MKEIKLRCSDLVALVDDDKYEELSGFVWRAHRSWGDSWRAAEITKNGTTYMHHLVIGRPPPNQEVDHIDRNGLNNQRNNLRFVTKSQNQYNAKVRSDNKSGFKGVTFIKTTGKWRARINTKVLGYFLSMQEAVNARKQAEKTIC